MKLEALVRALLQRRGLWALLLLILGLCATWGAARLPVDPSVERMHPEGDAAQALFERFRAAFPGEDTQVFVLAEGPALYQPSGMAQLARLSLRLGTLPDVRGVLSPTSALTAEGPLFPEEQRATEAHLKEAWAHARLHPLSRAFLHPHRALAWIQVSLKPERGAARIAAERRFAEEARALLQQEQHPTLKLTLSGAPAVRAALASLVERDLGLLLPWALFATLVLVAWAYRDGWALWATALTLMASVGGMLGAMGARQLPLGLLTSFAPIVVVLVALTDTVHILSDFEERRGRGTPHLDALSQAIAHAAWPCLLTEGVMAAGFLSMRFIGLTAVSEFGEACAWGVMMAWVANMTVLPWVLSLRPASSARRAGPERHAGPLPLLQRALDGVAHAVVQRPRRIAGVALVLLLLSLGSLLRLRTEFRVFDDLGEDTPLARELRYAEQALGGIVPLSIFLEPLKPHALAALSNPAMAFQARMAAFLSALPEHPPVTSVPALVKEVQKGIWGPQGPLVPTQEATQSALNRVAPFFPLDALLTADRSSAAVTALFPNLSAEQMRERVQQLNAEVQSHVPAGYRASVTGNLVMTSHVTGMLTEGLLLSLLSAVGVTLAAFSLALRSVKLALIGLIPNLFPLVLLFGLMAALNISLKPSTVLIASMALVIADDDTLQFLLRFQRRKRQGDPTREAVLSTLRECGRAMGVTSFAITAGFLLLQLSSFEGIAQLGLLTGLTLWAAGLADLFLTPVLLLWLEA